MCTRASTGISELILNAYSSMEGEGVSAYGKTPQNLPFSRMQSMDADENSNQNLDLEPCQIRQLGVYLRMLNQGLTIHRKDRCLASS